jgi:hypothetical protein
LGDDDQNFSLNVEAGSILWMNTTQEVISYNYGSMARYIILMFYNAIPSAIEIHTLLEEPENAMKCSCWRH